MTTISVLPSPGGPGPAFRAIQDGVEGTGAAPGEAIDDLFARTGRPKSTTVILLQPFGPDEFFSAAQRDRLAELMTQFRSARDAGRQLAPDVQTELDALVADEFRASAARCAALLAPARP